MLGIATILGLAFFIYKEHWELFQGNGVTFLDRATTQRFLIEDKDRYIINMSMVDIVARKCKNHREYTETAGGAAQDFLEGEKERLEIAAREAERWLRELQHPLVQYEALPWKFALTLPTYEEGLPHTRKDIIFLSRAHLQYPEEQLIRLLIHEWVHLYQRKNEGIFREKLLKAGYRVWRERKGYPRIRANPDLDNLIYIHPTGELMVGVYNSLFPGSISDVVYAGSVGEHPFEEVAYAVAELRK